ncbi:glycosyltransferase family 2 protein [Patescibacteria group bacterium]|nr:glycosyltransferase family 2 protein [Patescibacteria group bacterium]
MKKIDFVIVNYNTAELLKKCVDNLADIWPNMEIIVIDNDSSDGSREICEEYSQKGKIRFIRSKNEGLASAHNKALNISKADYICYLGTDAFPTKDAIKKLFGFMEISDGAGILSPKLVLRDGSIDWDAHRGFPTPLAAMTHFLSLDKLFFKSELFNQYFQGWKNLSKPHEIDACISHFMFTKGKIYEDGIKWDEDYFVFGEDIDFCYRVKEKGYKIYYLPQIEVLHYKGASIGRKQSKKILGENKNIRRIPIETKVKMARASTEAMRLFYRKHYMDKYPMWITSVIFNVIRVLEFIRITKVYLSS